MAVYGVLWQMVYGSTVNNGNAMVCSYWWCEWFAVNDDASGSQLMMMRVVKIVCFVFILGQIKIKKSWKLAVLFKSSLDEQIFLLFYFLLWDEINVALLTIGDDCYCSRIAMGFCFVVIIVRLR